MRLRIDVWRDTLLATLRDGSLRPDRNAVLGLRGNPRRRQFQRLVPALAFPFPSIPAKCSSPAALCRA